MIAYSERILATSASAQRLHRAERMLANVRPLLVALERAEAARVAPIAPPPSRDDDEEFEVVFSGKDSLSKFLKDTA